MGLERYIGIALIVIGIVGYVLAQSPLITAIFGGTIGDNIDWAGSIVIILIAAGLFLMLLSANPILAGGIALIAFIILWLMLNWSNILGGLGFA